MQEGRPSRTAWRVALRRAAHQLLDRPKVFDDPLALAILGAEGEAHLRQETAGGETTPLARFLRAFMAVRSRYAEDRLRAAVARGVDQYVVLGAGLDTFACRNPYPDLRVFEVDHPATQAWKRGRLEEAGIALPGSLTFAPVDFERQTLAEGLAAAGFRGDEPAFFSWLGVTPYLTREAIDATLGFIASTPAGGEVVFDYGLSPELLSPLQRRAVAALAERVEAAGEPFRTYFDPAALARDLTALGFGEVEDAGPETLNPRYFAGRADGLRMGGAGHLMRAVVGGTSCDKLASMKILLFGATGSAGGGVLRACLASPRVEEVRALVRRPLALKHDRLRPFVHGDYEDYAAVREAFAGVDACFFCLGISTTQVSGEAEYRRITHDFALAAARELSAGSPAAAFVFISGQGTNPGSRLMWARVKGETERELIDGFGATCFRPAAIDAPPSESGPRLYRLLRPLFLVLRPFRGLYVKGEDLGRAMLQAVAENLRGAILENRQIRDLADRAPAP